MANYDNILRNIFDSENRTDKDNSDGLPIREDSDKQVTSKDIQFVLETLSKQAPFDKIQINQIFYGICSSQTLTKIHHNINSKKSGEGKSYLLKLVVDLFPDSFILMFNNMSDKALYHQRGIEAVKNEETGKYEELSPLINKLESEIEKVVEKTEEEKNTNKQRQKDRHAIKSYRSQIKSIEEEIKDLRSKAVKIIHLEDKAFIFLDTPNEGLFNNLMSLLSQDSRDQLYIFTDKDSSGKRLQSRTVLLRGSPLIMTTQVVDDTRNYRFQEKNRRFIHVNPDTTENKIQEAMRQMTTKLSGLPDDFEGIVSAKDIQKAKEIVNNLCIKLKVHAHKCLDNNITGNGVKIPYASILSSSLPSSDSWSMTILSRLLNYIAIITKVKMDSRPKVVDIETGVYYPISIYDDLREALEIMRTASLSVRPYQQDWYTNLFLPAFGELGPEPNCKLSEHDGHVIARESVVGLTTKQLADRMTKLGENTSTVYVYENYLRPLIKQGVINSAQSVINGKEHIYYPVNCGNGDNDMSILTFSLTEDCRLILNKPFDEKKVLEESLRTLLIRRSNGCGIKYKIIDIDNSELSVEGLLEKYFFNSEYHTSCSVVLTKSYNGIIEECSTQEQPKGIGGPGNEEPNMEGSANDFIGSPKDIATSYDFPIYTYTVEDIEQFFASDSGQQEEHGLEESICGPLIGKQSNKPFLYYCKADPNVENIHLKSIEDHIRLKDPEIHKSKLFETTQKREKNEDNDIK